MIKYLRIYFPVFLLILFVQSSALAQNCTINAGSDRTICTGQPFTLIGAATGAFAQDAKWTQIDGPAIALSATTIVSGAPTATVAGYTNGVSYTFRLSAKCTDGSPVFDDAIYKASTLTVANAGPNRVECPGQMTFAANAVQSGETGTWSVVSGNLPVPDRQHDPHSTITLPATGNTVGTTIFRWTVTDGSGSCSTTSDVQVINLGGIFPVTATPLYHLGCYSVTASQQLAASFGGNGNGQIGTWSFLSGPSTPTFNDIHSNTATIGNLIQGTYKIRWTVEGPCAQGTADVELDIDAATQSVTDAGNPILTYCDGRTSTTLNGVKPLYTNESVKWTAPGFPGVTFSDNSAPTTVVSGLDGHSNYDFIYTVTNSVTGCTSTGTYHVRYTTPPSITLPASPQILDCGVAQIDIPYTVSGGNLTQWAMVSGPAGSTIANASGYNNYTTAASGTQTIVGLNLIGTYVIRFRRFNSDASGGCDESYADISVVVSQPPYQANAGTAQFLACSTTTATLAGNAPQLGDLGSGQWSLVSYPAGGIATIADKSLNTTAISNLKSGVYTFRWTVTGGYKQCGDTQSDVKVIVASTPTAINAGSDINVCYGTPVKLNGNAPQLNETGTWTLVSESPASPASTVIFSNIHDPNAIVNGLLVSKVYTLRWTISNSCGTITDDVIINTNTNNGPKQALAGADQCLTSGTSFSLAGNAPSGTEAGTWTLLPGAPNTPGFSTTANTQTVTGAVNGTYKFEWKLTNGACTTTQDTVVITISPVTTTALITAAPTGNICGTTAPITLTGTPAAATETGQWTQVAGPGGAVITTPSLNSTTVSGLAQGRYIFRWTIYNNACSNSFADTTFNVSESPTPSNAGVTQTLCDLTSTTMAATPVTVGSGLWSVVSGPNNPTFSSLSDPAATLSNLTLGTYVLQWTTANGPVCSSTSTVTITVGLSANAGADQNLCNTSTTVLTGNEGSTGTWTEVTGAPATITTNSNNTAIVTGLAPGNYVFRYTITAGGCGTLSDDMNITVDGPPSAAVTGPDQEICTSTTTSVSITATPPTVGTGKWSFLSKPAGSVAVITDVNSPSTTITGLSVDGIYLAQWTVTNTNCNGTQSNNDFTRITIYNPPTIAQPMSPQPAACKDNVILTGTVPVIGIGTWTQVSGPASTIDAPNSPTTTISNLTVSATVPYVYRWTIANGNCSSSSADVTINVLDNTPTIANAGTAANICTGTAGGLGSVILAANTPNTGDIGTWSVVSQPSGSPGVTFTGGVNNPAATADNLKAGTYVLRWAISNLSSCTSTSDVSITVTDPPSTADAGPATASYCLFSPVVLAAIPPVAGTTGSWSVDSKPHTTDPDPVFNSVNAYNATVTGLVKGTYRFVWTTSNGSCTNSSDFIDVSIDDCQIAVSKEQTGTPVQQPDGSFDVTFKFHVKNTGTAPVTNVQVEDDLTTTFTAPKTYTVKTASSSSTGTLVFNSTFNGNSNKNLLDNSSSTLAAGAEETITLVVNVKLN